MAVPDDWLDRAHYDVETAEAMLTARRYLYVLFCCQQAVEKALKALIAFRTGEMPPRLHNLTELAVKAGLNPDQPKADQMRLLTSYYVQSRYPAEATKLSAGLNRAIAARTLRYTQGIVKWLSTLTKS